jgi:putative DNA primase/helicase
MKIYVPDLPLLSDTPSPETQLWQALVNADFDPPPDIIFGSPEFYRWGKNKRYWCKAFDSVPPTAVYGDYVSGFEGKLICDTGVELSQLERFQAGKRLKEEIARAKAERESHAEYSSGIALRTWEAGTSASADHSYLKRKQIQPHSTRIASDGRLMVPMYRDGELASLQYITGDGDKRYQSGASTKGAWHMLGEPGNQLFIAEGFATAATIYEETGIATAVAFSAGNIPAAAEAIRSGHPAAAITVVADLDESGIGRSYAEQASAKYGCRVIVSPVSSDVNDYRAQGGDVRGMLMAEDSTALEKLKIFTGDQISDEYEPPDEIIEDILTSETVSMLYGASHSGKTFFALSLAVAVSNGDKTFGKHTDQGNVLYLATEAPRTIKDRLRAVRTHQGKDISNIYIVPVPVNLYASTEPVYDIIAACREIGNVKLIIGDTLARISAGADENFGKDMGPIMEKFDLIAHETGASVLIIHHSGKDTTKGSRGWSGVPGHLDAEIEIKNDGEHGEKIAIIKKQRELGTTGTEVQFKLEVVEAGIGKFGSMKTSCIVKEDRREKEKKPAKKGKEDLFFDFFKRAWFASGAVYDNKDPYITRAGLKAKMVEDRYAPSERTIDNHLAPSRTDGLIGCLISLGWIEQRAGGFAVINDAKASVMALEKEHPNSP